MSSSAFGVVAENEYWKIGDDLRVVCAGVMVCGATVDERTNELKLFRPRWFLGSVVEVKGTTELGLCRNVDR